MEARFASYHGHSPSSSRAMIAASRTAISVTPPMIVTMMIARSLNSAPQKLVLCVHYSRCYAFLQVPFRIVQGLIAPGVPAEASAPREHLDIRRGRYLLD